MLIPFQEEIVNFTNDSGERIHGVYNYTTKDRPLIVIPPQFEKTIRTNLTAMLYLINNGFNVFRYDNRYSNGNSTGEIVDYTLGGVYDDLCDVMKMLQSNSCIDTRHGVGILGISISSRVIYRYLKLHPSNADVFVSLVGVVNMQHTISTIVGFDVIQEKLNNPQQQYGVRKVLKYPINWDQFAPDMIGQNYHTLESTKQDIDGMTTPTYLIVSEKDQWVAIEEYQTAFQDNTAILRESYKLPGADHELYKNPETGRYALEKIVTLFRKFYQIDIGSDSLIKPTVTEVIQMNRQEREREQRQMLEEKILTKGESVVQ